MCWIAKSTSYGRMIGARNSQRTKMATNVVAPSSTDIFEKSIHNGIFPTEWKLARVTPALKKGINSVLDNYRPISVIYGSWLGNTDNGLLSGLLFLLTSKRLLTRSTTKLFHKMSYFGADHNTLKWFQSYVGNRSQRCNGNGSKLTARTITYGLPQGIILGPLLFLMYYIDAILNCLQNSSLRMFADDTNIRITMNNSLPAVQNTI